VKDIRSMQGSSAISNHFLVKTKYYFQNINRMEKKQEIQRKNQRLVMFQARGIKIKNNQDLMAVVYADDIVLIVETDNELKNRENILLKKGRKFGLKINETKTKYMIISRQNH